MPSSAAALALALNLCFPGDGAQSCAAPVADEALAASVAEIVVLGKGASVAETPAENLARDQLRVAGSMAETQIEIWWFTEGLDMILDGRERAAEPAPLPVIPLLIPRDGGLGPISMDINLRATTS